MALIAAVAAGLVGVAGAAIHTVGIGLNESDKPNVLFVLVDTLRKDHVQPTATPPPHPASCGSAKKAPCT